MNKLLKLLLISSYWEFMWKFSCTAPPDQITTGTQGFTVQW